MNPYFHLVSEYARLQTEGKSYPLGDFTPAQHPELKKGAFRILLFSPHPDDECIVSGLALRLLRESGMEVINVAVTQGSKKARQEERLKELQQACHYLSYGLRQTGPHGLEKINLSTRQQAPDHWRTSVGVIGDILRELQPKVIFFPHEQDWNSTHIGTHWLVKDALETMEPEYFCYLVETEFWGQMMAPNLMVESSVRDVTDLVTATTFHVGEVQRNPFHLLLPAWMQDNLRRGSELVGGQGEAAPDFNFATLYRLQQWSHGRVTPCFDGGKILSCQTDPGILFP
jgi:LmbE family N-acetylglucosaminyl deacetylase